MYDVGCFDTTKRFRSDISIGSLNMPWAEPGLIDEAAVPGRPTGAHLIGNWVHFVFLNQFGLGTFLPLKLLKI